MRKSIFTKYIQSLTEEEMRSELSRLYDEHKTVKDYYSMELGSAADRKKFFDKAKKEIRSRFATKTFHAPKRPRVGKVRSVLKQMEKVSVFKDEMADLYFFTCERILDFIAAYHYHSDPLYNTLVDAFKAGTVLVMMDMTEDKFLKRCTAIVEQTFDINEYVGSEMQVLYDEVFS